jgi:hypothetical protein
MIAIIPYLLLYADTRWHRRWNNEFPPHVLLSSAIPHIENAEDDRACSLLQYVDFTLRRELSSTGGTNFNHTSEELSGLIFSPT